MPHKSALSTAANFKTINSHLKYLHFTLTLIYSFSPKLACYCLSVSKRKNKKTYIFQLKMQIWRLLSLFSISFNLKKYFKCRRTFDCNSFRVQLKQQTAMENWNVTEFPVQPWRHQKAIQLISFGFSNCCYWNLK